VKYFVLLALLLPSLVRAETSSFSPLGGAYYDNVNNLTIKLGLAYQYETVFETLESNGEEYDQWTHSKFLFTDIEASTDSHLLSVGAGAHIYGGNFRAGLSHGTSDHNKQFGVTGTFSGMFLSFKAGFYKFEPGSNKFMLGIGFGY